MAMTEQQLIAKKTLYEAKKIEILDESHESEIAEKVQAYEKELRESISIQKTKDVAKIDSYLELLNALIEESRSEQIVDIDEQNQEQKQDVVDRPMMSIT